MDTLPSIKRTVIQKRILFSREARNEMTIHRLERWDVFEAIFNAPTIVQTMRLQNVRSKTKETQYIINGVALNGAFVCTKGKFDRVNDNEAVYVIVSAKRAAD